MNSFEMSSVRKDRDFCIEKINRKSPVVEVFSRMVKGKNLQEFYRNKYTKSFKAFS